MHCILLAHFLLLMCQQALGISFTNSPSPETCKLTPEGIYYSGELSVASSDKTCQDWSTKPDFYAAAFGNISSLELRNYCRAPLINDATNIPDEPDMPDGPWCFTSTGSEYCDVPHCSEEQFKTTRQCLLDNGFLSYAGKATPPNGECLQWTEDIVQAQGMELWQFPGSYSWEEMSNYCRNPDNHPYPWCYNKDVYESKRRLEKLECADLPSCSTKCRLTEGSLEYIGKKSQSETRKDCVPAQLAIPAIFEEEAEQRRWFEEKYVNDDFFVNLTECRSYPDQLVGMGNKDGPVCYVEDSDSPGGIKEDRCTIYYCDPPPGSEIPFAYTTESDVYETDAPYVETTTSVEVREAWDVLNNWESYKIKSPPYTSALSTGIGVAMWSVTGFLLICLMLLDCSSLPQCTEKCKSNSKQISGKMKDLYGSHISLRKNQISPDLTENEVSLKKLNKLPEHQHRKI